MDRNIELYQAILDINDTLNTLKAEPGVRVDHQAESTTRTFQDVIDELLGPDQMDSDPVQWNNVLTELMFWRIDASRQKIYYYDKAMAIKQWLMDNAHTVPENMRYRPHPIGVR